MGMGGPLNLLKIILNTKVRITDSRASSATLSNFSANRGVQKLLTLSLLLAGFALLILAGWGFDDLRGYLSNWERLSLIATVVLGVAAAFIFNVELQPIRLGRHATHGQTIALLGMFIASLSLVWFLSYSDRRQILALSSGNQTLRFAGLLLCIGGIIVRIAALSKIGKQFSAYVTLQTNHELIQSGIYQRIRHPLYLSLLLAAPGLALVFDSVLVWPILAVTSIFVGLRIHQEEGLLRSEFGRLFDEYRKRTWSLLPPIY
jgi:protein-S-isoprenylcysteine O-methyltransferase Ste14